MRQREGAGKEILRYPREPFEEIEHTLPDSSCDGALGLYLHAS